MTHYLIESMEHSRDGVKYWWKPDRNGYTRDITAAGRYTYQVAKNLVDQSNVVVPSERMWTEEEVLNELAGPTEVIVLVAQ